MKTIDLHVHSLVSDGSFTPRELAVHAKEQGLSAFALTDHDVIAGTEEAAAAAQEVGVEFINGMELTADFKGHKIHVVCLGFDAKHAAFQTVYKKVRAIKEGRIEDIIEFVRRKGVDISWEKVEKFAYQGLMDRYAIMRYLVSLQMYDRAQPLWDNYLDPAAVELGLNFSITAEEALPLIHKAGGVTSLAHFHKNIGLGNLDSRQQQEQAILELHQLGLDGMERYYPNYTAEDEAFAAQMIQKYDLLSTGGTDFHGSNRPQIEMGTGIDGNMEIPYSFFEEIKTRLEK
ncbi:hypothetical protein SAMN05216582_12126 [Selenomonas ruminantium]|uniref:Polymerase/histidinol phosphatase N-terminal domain-containing protein n=1 Tax=Selenomonas ruminantium TaxID=971 RepID=A0A1M6VXS3_SELRU|nr:PHP domain-containing protein [Selenomonas ruminantium]SHK86135.1 hypothetical protein SAMN05216582_12126 [Selenomonas ruminantium]